MNTFTDTKQAKNKEHRIYLHRAKDRMNYMNRMNVYTDTQ